MMGHANPTMWRFMSKLQIIEQAERLKLHEIKVWKNKKKHFSQHIRTNKNIIHLCENYGKWKDNKLGFFKQVAGFMCLSY